MGGAGRRRGGAVAASARDAAGLPAAMLAGAAGALLAYYGGQLAHLYADGQVLAWTAAVAGAMAVPAAWGLLRG